MQRQQTTTLSKKKKKACCRLNIKTLTIIASITVCIPYYIMTGRMERSRMYMTTTTMVDSDDIIGSKQQEQNINDNQNLFQEKEKFQKPRFPSPVEAIAATTSAQVILRPKWGQHHPSGDAVFAFAEGYDLNVYMLFVTSLRNTGYDGDIVLSVASEDKLAAGVEEFLRYHAEEKGGLVVYTVDWECYRKSGVKFEKTGTTTTNNGFSDCNIHGLYGNPTTNQPLDDPRKARPVATARYELYWAWSLQYNWNSRILLIDVRDTYFQKNPFRGVKRLDDVEEQERMGGGVLRLYEENRNATSIGRSSYNSQWIRSAYNQTILSLFSNKPVICSGSTIGDQVAIESYLRGMVLQYDETECKRVGCDQGLHNVLYYSHLLDDVFGISKVVVYVQGRGGAVNNLAALREEKLRVQGVLQEGTDWVVDWDGKTVSDVVHQFDRDKDLHRIMRRRAGKMMNDWKELSAKRKKELS